MTTPLTEQADQHSPLVCTILDRIEDLPDVGHLYLLEPIVLNNVFYE